MSKPFIVSFVLGLLMVSSSVIAKFMTPTADMVDKANRVNLETLIPGEFNGWKKDLTVLSPIVNPEVESELGKIYTQTLSRTYINGKGERVMLSIAYGDDQRTDLQIHRPEICYRTSGFEVSAMTKILVDTTIGQIPAMRLVAKQGPRNEPITYWIRMGDTVTRGWFEQKAATFRYGLTGRVPDGLLFRVSTISNDEQASYRIQQAFMASLLQSLPSNSRHWLIGNMANL